MLRLCLTKSAKVIFLIFWVDPFINFHVSLQAPVFIFKPFFKTYLTSIVIGNALILIFESGRCEPGFTGGILPVDVAVRFNSKCPSSKKGTFRTKKNDSLIYNSTDKFYLYKTVQ